eukprot:2792381-Pyramimonas_sp.AAC.1
MRGHPAITVKWCLTGTAGAVARGLLCAGPPNKMMGIGFRQGWSGPTCFPMCAVTCAGSLDALCTCPESGAPGAAGVCGTPGALGA